MDRNILINWLNKGSVSIPIQLIENYKKLGLFENEVMLLIHVYTFIQRGTSFPTPEMLASQMSLSENECITILQSLLKRGYLELNERNDDNNIIYEAFSLTPLWDKLIVLTCEEKVEKKIATKEEDERNLYQLFETEFGRPLSPMECELITMWLDQESYSPSIIKAALMEGVVSGKRNLRYIDRILIEWDKNGVKTVQQAKEYGQKFRNHQYKATPSQQPEPKKKFPTYNWLKD